MRKSLVVVSLLISLTVLSCISRQDIESTQTPIATQTEKNLSLPSLTSTPFQTPADAPKEYEVYNISASPSGEMIAVSASYGVQVYSLLNGELLYYFEKESQISFQGIYSYIAWSPNSDFLAVGKPNVGVRIWDSSTWNIVAENGGDEISGYELPGFAWSPDGNQLALGMGKGEIQIWDKNLKTWVKNINCDVAQVSLTWTPEGQIWIFSHSGFYNASTCKKIGRSDIGIDGGYGYAVWSPDNKNIYIFFDLGGSITNINKSDAMFGICCYPEIAWSRDGRYFAATPEGDNTITIWDTIDRDSYVYTEGSIVDAFSWSLDNDLLVLGSIRDSNNVIWSTRTGRILATLKQ